MSDTPAIRPKAQALSNAIMEWRFAELEVRQKALLALNALYDLQKELMEDPEIGKKIGGMDAGDVDEALYISASGYGAARKVHTWLRELGKRLGVATPLAPSYSDEYRDLVASHVNVGLSPPARR